MEAQLTATLLAARARLARQDLLAPQADASLSLRLADTTSVLYLPAAANTVQRVSLALPSQDNDSALAAHLMIYRQRADVGAIALGGGPYGRQLAGFGGALPPSFDEQARHLGIMAGPLDTLSATAIRAALRRGGNALLLGAVPICLGVNCQRLVFNSELFEKCAKAFVLAAATGVTLTRLPWWVCRIANGRLLRDERQAAGRFAQGLLPEEARGY